MRRLRNAALDIALLVLSLTACNPRDVGTFSVVERLGLARVDEIGPVEAVASCREGEQLVGGGYVVSSVVTLSGGPGSEPASPIIVEASHPTGPNANSWIVRAFNPDLEPNGPNRGSFVVAEAYCLTGTFPVRIEHVTSAAVTIQFDESTDVSVACPTGAVATSGGFETTHTVPHAGLFNAWLLSSLPVLDGSGTSVGWEVNHHVISWTDEIDLPETRVHALCATQNLEGAPAAESPILPTAVFFYWHYEGTSQCPRGQFAVGGGYRFVGDPLVPHLTYESQSSDSFQGWGLEAVYGHQSNASGKVEGWAACLLEPDADLIVQIVSPAAGSFIGPSSTGGQTDPVTFNAVAVNGDGDPVSGIVFEWTDNGQPFGSGASITATLSAGGCEKFISHDITVVGTDPDGNTATDAITVYAGQIC